MTQRQLICACEDVTRDEIEEAVHHGHVDMESVKRYTGLGTGICQGRNCQNPLARLLCELGVSAERLAPTTPRTPLVPTPLGVLAAEGPLPAMYPSNERPAEPVPTFAPRAAGELPPLPKRAQIVIVGGGIMGLATAYHLAACGVRDVLVLERSYLNAGASGRNGGGIREQWATEQNILVMQESIERCKRFAKDFGVNVWMRQGGYLFLATRPDIARKMEQNVAVQNRLGVRTRMLTASQARSVVSRLAVDDLHGACFNPDDGVIFPWPFLWGYANRARELGVQIATFTEVTGIDVRAGAVCAVETSRGRVECDMVVNAAAAWAPEIARMVGVSVPNKPERHEILVTESLKPFLDPLVSELGTGLYFSQSMRGEIVGGMGDPDEPAGLEMRSSLRFAVRMARALVHRMPELAQVKVVRQWAGCYDKTPDHNPIMGFVDEVKGFFQLHGFVGHGFMMAPAVSRIAAEYIAQGREHDFVTQNALSRFSSGKPLVAETLIIG